ncbi:helix-turn-helix domain-containing protein [Nocardiopsis ganjiahuensis]|uniref:helix-turn-helix domain-containing protein n=1 Tax=Nocardiopsis ganjiahuensis TaxID=239984 RepID=UPI0005950EAC|nr:helix-turn-helix transcriptional regulator [Nocardiopsis ganjiahuensis]
MTSSPTVWRRWLAHELKRLRLEAGLSRQQVADKLRCTPAKVGHFETAVVPPRVRDLEEILFDLYNVPEDRREHYLQAARDAKKKGWWERHSESVPDWFSLYIGLEQGATDIYSWQPQLIDGLLQTRAYIEAVMRGGIAELDEEEIERRVELRLSRQQVLKREDAPRLWAVLDVSALRRNIGGPGVMREQLRYLLEVSHLPKITLQVVDGRSGAHPGLISSFCIMNFEAEMDPGLVYIEYRTGALYLERPAEIRDHQIAYEHLRLAALRPQQSRDLITQLIEEHP